MAFIAKLGEQSYTVEIEETGKSVYRVSVDGNEFLVDGKKTGRTNYSLIVDNRSFEIEVDNSEDEYRVLVDGRSYRIELVDERRMRVGGAQSGLALQGRQKVSVPMPGKVIAILVAEGDRRGKRAGFGDRRSHEDGKRGAQPDRRRGKGDQGQTGRHRGGRRGSPDRRVMRSYLNFTAKCCHGVPFML